MSQTNSATSILDQEAQLGDAVDQPGIDYPFSQAEIDELLYSEAYRADERLARLRELRDQITARREAEWMGDDPQNLLDEIENAIQRLEPAATAWREDDVYALDETVQDVDPLDHRETLAPDDDELLDALDREAESVASDQQQQAEVLDQSEWTDDGFNPERGTR